MMIEYLNSTSIPFMWLLVFTGFILLIIHSLKPKKINGIPVLPSNSIIGYTHTIIPSHSNGKGHYALFDEVEKYIENPGLVQYYLLGQHIVLILDACLAKQALLTITGKKNLVSRDTVLGHPNIVNLDTGSDWHIRRKSFRSAFSANSLRYFEDSVRLIVSKIISGFHKFAESKEIVEIDLFFGRMTIDVICKVGFQYDMNAIGDSKIFQEVHKAIRSLFEDFGLALLPYSGWLLGLPLPIKCIQKQKQIQNIITDFSKLLFNHIKVLDLKGEIKENSLAKSLLKFSTLPNITENDILSEIIVLFIAGFETTAHTLSFVVYSLATNSEVQLKAQQAIDEVSKAKEERVTVNDEEENKKILMEKTTNANAKKPTNNGAGSNSVLLPPYVEAVIKESMRKYPVVGVGSRRLVKQEGGVVLSRTAKENRPEASYMIPKGSWVVCPSFVIHNSSAAWGSDAQVFNPDRWLPKSSEGEKEEEAAAAASSSTESAEKTCCPDVSAAATEASNDTSTATSCPLSSASIYAGGGAREGELSFFPFSHGVRNCIGMNLALLEIRITVAELLKRFSFQLADESMRDERNVLETYLTMRPRENLPVIISLR